MPASRTQAAAAVTAVVAMTGADMGADDITTLSVMVTRRGYTEAELAYAMEELMYDEKLDQKLRFRDAITPADFERLIGAHRAMRRRLQQLLSRYEMNRLIDDYPEHISRDDFGVAGYDSRNEPLFRFKSDPSTPNGTMCPTLEDDPARRERPDDDSPDYTMSNVTTIGDAVSDAISDE